MTIGVLEATAVLALITALGLLLAVMEAPPRNPARYSGPVYDPQRGAIRRAGAVGYTGRKCPLCGQTTFGNSDRCGACGRLNIPAPVAPYESTKLLSLHPARPSLVASESPFSDARPRSTPTRHDLPAAATHAEGK